VFHPKDETAAIVNLKKGIASAFSHKLVMRGRSARPSSLTRPISPPPACPADPSTPATPYTALVSSAMGRRKKHIVNTIPEDGQRRAVYHFSLLEQRADLQAATT